MGEKKIYYSKIHTVVLSSEFSNRKIISRSQIIGYKTQMEKRGQNFVSSI
jgi:hypothetical protein